MDKFPRTRGGKSLLTRPRHSVDESGHRSTKESLVAFLGLTGSGKSSFINLLLGKSEAKVGHSITSETTEVASYQLKHKGTKIVFVDTPGFDDTTRSDSEVLRQLYDWLKSTYSDGRKLNAVFYLHNITDKRMRGSTVRNLYAFRKLCDEDFSPSILLATSFWPKAKPLKLDDAQAREEELQTTDIFWKSLLGGGAQYARLPDDRASALDLLMSMARKAPKVMQAQVEAVVELQTFDKSAAHESLNRDLAEKAKRHERENEAITKQGNEAQAAAAVQAEKDRLEKHELKRINDARFEAERLHREKLAAAAEEQERVAQRQKELDEAMRKLKIHTARKEIRDAFQERLQQHISKMVVWQVDWSMLCSDIRAYQLRCDNCMESIGYGRYYCEFHPYRARVNGSASIFSRISCYSG